MSEEDWRAAVGRRLTEIVALFDQQADAARTLAAIWCHQTLVDLAREYLIEQGTTVAYKKPWEILDEFFNELKLDDKVKKELNSFRLSRNGFVHDYDTARESEIGGFFQLMYLCY